MNITKLNMANKMLASAIRFEAEGDHEKAERWFAKAVAKEIEAFAEE